MKAAYLVLAIFISLWLLIYHLMPWCACHLPVQASVVITCITAFAIIFGLCGALGRELGIY